MIRRWLGRAEQAWDGLGPAGRRTLAGILWILATIPVLSRQTVGAAQFDLIVFMGGVDALLQGGVYRDAAFEYPLYSLLWFLVPRAVSADLAAFRVAFGLQIWIIDAILKGLLLWLGLRTHAGVRSLVPFFAYTLATAALGHFLLQRFDLAVAALTVVAAVASAAAWPLAAGATLALAAGSKVYPLLFVPVLGVLHWRDGRRDLFRFASGITLALAPMAVAALWLPWWRFASYHAARGFQAESLYATIVWALHFAGAPAQWEFMPAFRSIEVVGPLAAALVAPSRLLWLGASFASLAMATLAAWRVFARPRGGFQRVPVVAALMLLPVTTFVTTNTVLSPQFHLWLLPLAALVLLATPADRGDDAALALPRDIVRGAIGLVVAALIVPVFIANREYATGLGPFRTLSLLCRNGLLIYSTITLWRGVRTMYRRSGPGHPIEAAEQTR